MRKKAETDDITPSIAPGELTSKQFRRNWARLIQKIFEVDPLCCSNCLHKMRIIGFLEAGPIVEKILVHLDPILFPISDHSPMPYCLAVRSRPPRPQYVVVVKGSVRTEHI